MEQNRRKIPFKETFYCEYCSVPLNSIESKESHVKGQKHVKMVRDEKASMRHGGGASRFAERKAVRRIDNPDPVRKKNPVRLRIKIADAEDPVVGLGYIDEFLPVSNPEMEPWYECFLCMRVGEANAMLSHLVGKGHRQKFFAKKYDDPKYLSYSPTDLARFASRNPENSSVDEFINTTKDDKVFPWPAGKAPWSVVQGGSGEAPADARKRHETPADSRKRHAGEQIWSHAERGVDGQQTDSDDDDGMPAAAAAMGDGGERQLRLENVEVSDDNYADLVRHLEKANDEAQAFFKRAGQTEAILEHCETLKFAYRSMKKDD